MGGHSLAVGMGSDFVLSDLLKPHLSLALPHWKRTRVSAGQLEHNITIASTLTFQASLITSTRNGQEYWQVKWERVTLKASLISPALGKPAPDRTRLLAGAQMKGAKRCPKLGGSRYLKT